MLPGNVHELPAQLVVGPVGPIEGWRVVGCVGLVNEFEWHGELPPNRRWSIKDLPVINNGNIPFQLI